MTQAITGGPDVVCVNILTFTGTKWEKSSKLPRTKIVQKSKYNKTKLKDTFNGTSPSSFWPVKVAFF